VSSAYHSLGQSHLMLKNYTQAEEAHKECLQRRKEYFGPMHEDVGWTHNNLGFVYTEAGRFKEAEQHLELAMDIWETSLGSDHKNVGTALSNLCILRDYQGRA
jgi:tetratricopeptide (TPR) repeat protein